MNESLVFVAAYIGAAAVIALVARALGRDAADHFWGSLLLTPVLGLYALLVGRPD